jgi:hypothetical protein
VSSDAVGNKVVQRLFNPLRIAGDCGGRFDALRELHLRPFRKRLRFVQDAIHERSSAD